MVKDAKDDARIAGGGDLHDGLMVGPPCEVEAVSYACSDLISGAQVHAYLRGTWTSVPNDERVRIVAARGDQDVETRRFVRGETSKN